MKKNSKNEIEIIVDSIPENYNTNNCWLCGKKLNYQNVARYLEKKSFPICNEISIVRDHCNLTGNIRGLAPNY